jgi:hypothetical protein
MGRFKTFFTISIGTKSAPAVNSEDELLSRLFERLR